MAYDTFSETNPSETPMNGATPPNSAGAIAPETDDFDDRPQKAPPSSGNWLSGWRGVAVGLGAGILLSAGGMQLVSQPSESKPEATPSPAPATAVQSVTVAEVTSDRVDRVLEATGSIAAYDMLPLMPRATGLQIEQVLVDEGDYVEAGQTLVVLDDSVLQAESEQVKAGVRQAEAQLAELRAGSRREEIGRAEANLAALEAQVRDRESALELAEQKVRRNRNLAAEGAIARDRLDEVLTDERRARADLDATRERLREAREQLAQVRRGPRPEAIARAEAQLAEARGRLRAIETQLDQTVVRSPASGTLAERMARVGDLTSSTNKLFSLIRNNQLELLAKVPETQLPQINIGAPVKVTSDADSRINVEGTVREIAPLVDEESREATVKIDLPNSQLLRPGMFLNAAITTSTTQGLTLPGKAILPQSDGNFIVYRLNSDNTVEAKTVEVGSMVGEDNRELSDAKVEIKSGLNAGDRVVVEGAGYLKDGDRVKVVED